MNTDYEEVSEYFAHQLYCLVTDGDLDMDDCFNLMRQCGYIDSNDEWIYEEK
jgi:hypothetical protein